MTLPGPADRLNSRLGMVVWTLAAAFGTYFCMYAFRKPFTAAAFADESTWGIGFKTILVTAQVAGYTLSKFLGIRIVSELPPRKRAVGILLLVATAELALVLFAVTPAPWNAACLFLNGLPLGMVFGLVLGFLEGRRVTEVLTAGLCASFILADGVMKSVGAQLLVEGLSESWMPAAAGGLFLLPLGAFVAMLARVPPPSAVDQAARTPRQTLDRDGRRALAGRYAFGLTLIVLVYILVTILRSFRADFAPELWKGLGESAAPAQFTYSEIWVALGVLAVSGCSVLIRDNRRAFFASLGVCLVGFALLGLAVLGFRAGWLGAFGFMVAIGLGLHLPYVTIHTTLFERLLATTRDVGTIGFLMYVADAFGYLGYVAVMLGHEWISEQGNHLYYFNELCVWGGGGAAVCIFSAGLYFRDKTRTHRVIEELVHV